MLCAKTALIGEICTKRAYVIHNLNVKLNNIGQYMHFLAKQEHHKTLGNQLSSPELQSLFEKDEKKKHAHPSATNKQFL